MSEAGVVSPLLFSTRNEVFGSAASCYSGTPVEAVENSAQGRAHQQIIMG